MPRELDCVGCGISPCAETGEANRVLDGCPMMAAENELRSAFQVYETDELTKNMACAAARIEAKGYMKWTRVEDTMEFARLMGYKKLGIACCVGLKREAAILHGILRKNGFEVSSVVCKTGGVPKERLGLQDAEKVCPGRFEVMCNPIAQAKLLDAAGSELNILVGLCVGHDALFTKASRAPVTTLIAKDRVLGHNPVAALYNHQSYYRRRLYEEHL
jgi:uncharacterized metal-binding protein